MQSQHLTATSVSLIGLTDTTCQKTRENLYREWATTATYPLLRRSKEIDYYRQLSQLRGEMTILTRGQVVKRWSNGGKNVRLKGQPLPYQCVRCQKWVEENGAAMSPEGVMCLDCYLRGLQQKQERDDPSSARLARLYQVKQ
jgi:hypothetical protein